MKHWTHLVIDVDYCPSDPGINNNFCERTVIAWEDVKEGAFVHYEDPSGKLASIKIIEKTPEKLVIESANNTRTLDENKDSVKLDETGLNYTDFYLYAYLRFA